MTKDISRPQLPVKRLAEGVVHVEKIVGSITPKIADLKALAARLEEP